ncbi:septal ring lytic transglycosylase RlpA family protein [Reichenbachiella versicolor]|uniref:septal ring lytic transglycosylase RlpA family protein n=1 Tax=Reichenbachiella versicolor TaxID=1821036 RepID=UPI0013A58FA9|nr:septal ring lytic transglycosylase RlpA family protein [Reichenbachiella versicolor]
MMKSFIRLCFLLSVLASCKSTNVLTSQGTNAKGTTIETGVASWYGPGFHGKKTANGEKFNTNAYTAAHRTLPFGTELRVENKRNGKSVVVRINDRGPYAKDRIIDLSKAAASKLDMIERGTAPVELFLIGKNQSDLEVEDLKKPTYTVQIASFGDKTNASAKAKQHKGAWVKRSISNKKTVYRVYVGKYSNTSGAELKKKQLKSKGVSGFVKQVEN